METKNPKPPVKFKKGDHVAMINCAEAEHYPGEVWECRTDSYIDKANQEVVFLNMFSGCFLCSYLVKVDLPVTKVQQPVTKEGAKEEPELTKARLLDLGFEEKNNYLWYEWFPFALQLVDCDEYLHGEPKKPYWGLYCANALLLTSLRDETHLCELFKAHKVVLPRNIQQATPPPTKGEGMVTLKQTEEYLSEMAQEGLQREAKSFIKKSKDCGLMAPEICYIAHQLLISLSETAHRQIKMFGKNGQLDNTLADAQALLDKLKDKTPPSQ